ncbi:helix-turn-helix domain-containing protein [Mesobacillus maritimus]|uniref:helix-turn-helix domain-containing protein n=1 Tax=Mesobacillus maritimus TaxID=1643336 RepID=UPI00203EBD4D|nr:helix-turn-helix domain-containing protein [Mesobacillus maritimus]
MTISFKEAVFLYCMKQIQNERSIYSLYHLFQGKKSSQTIQDAHLFRLDPFFQSYPQITREEMDHIIGVLHVNGYLHSISSEYYYLTEKGEKIVQSQNLISLPPKYLQGWKYHQITSVFWERLSLLVQVYSNLIYQNKGFIPIHNKPENLAWIKNYIKMQTGKRFELANDLYTELINCFQQDENIDPAVLTLRLTGHNKIGLTEGQAAEQLQMDSFHYHLEFLNILHYMIYISTNQYSKFPLLSGIIGNKPQTVPLTLSTEKTLRLLEKGFNTNEIARIRKLKESTIEDHIVEIALQVNDFDLRKYVSFEMEQRILTVTRETSAKKLSQIREKVPEANYFEIRLVLARNGGRPWN